MLTPRFQGLKTGGNLTPKMTSQGVLGFIFFRVFFDLFLFIDFLNWKNRFSTVGNWVLVGMVGAGWIWNGNKPRTCFSTRKKHEKYWIDGWQVHPPRLFFLQEHDSLSQWLNGSKRLKLFGITYLVGKISRSNFSFQGPGRLSEMRG